MIRVFDFETTGLSPADGAEVCELGFCDLLPNGTITDPISQLFGITGPMPPEVNVREFRRVFRVMDFFTNIRTNQPPALLRHTKVHLASSLRTKL